MEGTTKRNWNTDLLEDMAKAFAVGAVVGAAERALKQEGLIEPNLAPLLPTPIMASALAIYKRHGDVDAGTSLALGGLPASLGYMFGDTCYQAVQYGQFLMR